MLTQSSRLEIKRPKLTASGQTPGRILVRTEPGLVQLIKVYGEAFENDIPFSHFRIRLCLHRCHRASGTAVAERSGIDFSPALE